MISRAEAGADLRLGAHDIELIEANAQIESQVGKEGKAVLQIESEDVSGSAVLKGYLFQPTAMMRTLVRFAVIRILVLLSVIRIVGTVPASVELEAFP